MKVPCDQWYTDHMETCGIPVTCHFASWLRSHKERVDVRADGPYWRSKRLTSSTVRSTYYAAFPELL